MPAHRPTLATVVALVATVGLLPFGLSLVSSLSASGSTATAASATGVGTGGYAASWLAISTGSPSSITLNDASGQRGPAQTLAPGPACGVDQGSAASRLITIEGATRANFSDTLASYNNGSIGVKEKKSGTSCSQVNSANEQLRLSLGDGLQAMTSPSTRASSAYLDLELKQSARIVATLSLNGTQTGSYELQSGASVGLPTSTGSPAFVCSAGADSGPDSGVNDNCRWPISMPSWTGADDGVFFDAITLKALSGSFSLEGGGDGIVLPQSPTSTPNASIIEVVDGVIECGGKTRTEAANGDEPEVTVYRLDNADGSPCSAVPYALSNSYAAARFLKPLGTQTSAQFIWDLTWLMPPTPGSSDLPDVTIDYETGVPTRVALGWCPDATYAPDGTFHGYDANQVAALPDQDEYPGSQFACLIARHATSTALSPDKVQVHDLVYVLGDAKMQW